MANWTPAQLSAIETKNKTLLLSAAAGSGKTTTLTERIIRSITDDGADISNMLIVTFTRASAADLKTKITNAINAALANDPSNAHLSGQLIKLVSAKISTIDSFYLNSVKQNFSALKLSSSFRIADETETVLLAKDVARSVVRDFYDNDSDFPLLCECFEDIKDTDDDIIAGIIIDIYVRRLRTIPEGVDYLEICADQAKKASKESFFDSTYGEILKKYTLSAFCAYLSEYDKIIDEKMPRDEKLLSAYGQSLSEDRLFCIKVVNALEQKSGSDDYAYIKSLINGYVFSDIGKLSSKFASDLSSYCKKFRDDFKKTVEKFKKDYYCYSPDDFSRFFTDTASLLYTLHRVMCEFESRYMEEKKRRNILELADIKRYAYNLFVSKDKTPTEYAKIVSAQYSHIYIDEYQDVDPVQDLIFSCISTPTNRFMVGDIKQSIYRFRDAKPQLFADYRIKFPSHGTKEAQSSDCETIFMSENFRCTEKIIDFTNLVCGDIFRACKDSIGYTSADDLVYPQAKKADQAITPSEPDINVAIFAKPKQSMPKKFEDGTPIPSPEQAEAKYVAQNIYRLITEEKRLNGDKIKPSDISVIYRSNAAAFAITQALSEYGIQTTNSDASQYFQNPDVVMTLCILNAIDNPQRDVHLAGALRSPIFGFTLEELMLINSYGDRSYSLYDKLCLCSEQSTSLGDKCREFKIILEEWRCISVSMPIDKFLRKIFACDKFVASGLVSDKNDMGEGGNLQTLYEYARTFEAGSFKGLYNFIEFINTLIENGKTLNVKKDDVSDKCVKLSTIHSSKGLEFPVCFVVGCGGEFMCNKPQPIYSFEYGVGMAMSIPDKTGFAKYISPLKKIIDLYSKLKGVEEEMRVLYVALTRAKEQLFISGHYGKPLIGTALSSAKYNAEFKCDYNILSASCFMDWILPVFFGDEELSYAHFTACPTDAVHIENDVQANDTVENEEYNQELYDYLKKSFEFVYPYSALGRIPAKLSVSKLSPDILDENDNSMSLFDSDTSHNIPDFFLSSPKGTSATQRGTATHNFLQFCDFKYTLENGIDKSIAMLIAKGFIPDVYESMIYKKELEKLFSGDFINQILSAKKIIREQRFNIFLPSEYFTENEELRESISSEKIAVQGVIDLILIDGDGNINLFDYKTDRLTKEELNDDLLAKDKINKLHGLQLSYYAQAVTRLFGKPPSRVAVYSTHASKLFDILLQPLVISADRL